MSGVKGRSGGSRKGAGRKPGSGGARPGAGCKPFAPTDEQRHVVEMAAAFGLTREHICQLVLNPKTKAPIEIRTLNHYFQAELDCGSPKAVATVAGALFKNAVELNNVTAQIFYLKTRGRWSEPPIYLNGNTNNNVNINVDVSETRRVIWGELEAIKGRLIETGAIRALEHFEGVSDAESECVDSGTAGGSDGDGAG